MTINLFKTYGVMKYHQKRIQAKSSRKNEIKDYRHPTEKILGF